jgi:hypothetical protein
MVREPSPPIVIMASMPRGVLNNLFGGLFHDLLDAFDRVQAEAIAAIGCTESPPRGGRMPLTS